MTAKTTTESLDLFGEATRTWFEASFEGATRAQAEGWAEIAGGKDTLISAPTGSGASTAPSDPEAGSGSVDAAAAGVSATGVASTGAAAAAPAPVMSRI